MAGRLHESFHERDQSTVPRTGACIRCYPTSGKNLIIFQDEIGEKRSEEDQKKHAHDKLVCVQIFT